MLPPVRPRCRTRHSRSRVNGTNRTGITAVCFTCPPRFSSK
jgi:hypothetical protein